MNTLITGAKEAIKNGHISLGTGSKDSANIWWHGQYTVALGKRLEQYEKGIELKDVIV